MGELFSKFAENLQTITWQEIAINIIVAFVLGLFISWIYRKTYRGFSFSATFCQTLVILSMVTTLVMMVIGNSIARAFSLVGAMAIIRFRTPVKDTRDTAFVFLSLAAGMATGTGAIAIALEGTAIIGALIYLISRTQLGEGRSDDYMLRFQQRTDDKDDSAHRDVFKKYLKKSTLLNITTLDQGKVMELTYNVRFKYSIQKRKFINELSRIDGIQNAMLMLIDKEE